VIQRHLFRECRSRLDDSNLYIRNAVENPSHKSTIHKESCDDKIAELSRLLHDQEPPFVMCFGQFAFECALRAWPEEEKLHKPERSRRYWTVERLAEQFGSTISRTRLDSVNLLPLLNVLVAQQFSYCHRVCSGGKSGNSNYFEYAGGEIAKALIQHRNHPKLSRLWL
jgi:hypothetical protein